MFIQPKYVSWYLTLVKFLGSPLWISGTREKSSTQTPKITGWWLTYPSWKTWVSWEIYIFSIWWESHKIPWFQSPPTRSVVAGLWIFKTSQSSTLRAMARLASSCLSPAAAPWVVRSHPSAPASGPVPSPRPPVSSSAAPALLAISWTGPGWG